MNANMFNQRWKGRYIQSSTKSMTANDTATFDMNIEFNDMATDARSQGYRMQIHHLVISHEITYTTIANPQVINTNANNVRACFNLKTSVPVAPSLYYPNLTSLCTVKTEGTLANTDPYCVLPELDVMSSRFPPVICTPLTVGFPDKMELTLTTDSSLYSQDHAGGAEFIPISNVGGITRTIKLRTVMPMCVKSGNSQFAWEDIDVVPAELFTSAANTALITISKDKVATIPNILNRAGISCAVASIDVSISAYVTYSPMSAPSRFGVPWGSDQFSVNSTGFKAPSDLYRYIGIVPAVSLYSDGNARLAWKPNDYFAGAVPFDSDAALINWVFGANTTWPGNVKNFLRTTVQTHNRIARYGQGCSQYFESGTVKGCLFSGPGTALAGATIEATPAFADVLGLNTFMQVLPLAMGSTVLKGFAPGFMGMPGAPGDMLVNLKGFALDATMIGSARAMILSGGQNYQNVNSALRKLSKDGTINGNGANTFVPLVDAGGQMHTNLASLVVPYAER